MVAQSLNAHVRRGGTLGLPVSLLSLMRIVALLLFLSSLAVAQGVDEVADQAARPNTSPRVRLELMQGLMKREGGPAALAAVALDPGRDPEVVHTAVEVLLDAGLGGDHLARICALLLSDRHRAKVEERLYRHTQQNPVQGRLLVAQLGHLAREPKGEPEAALDGRLAAIRALGKVPLREAVDVIALVWSESAGAIAARCSVELADVLDASSGDHAIQLLTERPFASYTDLVKEVSRKRAEQNRKHIKTIARLREMAFRQATAAEVFRTFEEGDPNLKPFAAARARVLASEKKYGEKGAEAFAADVVTWLLAELNGGSNETSANLITALQAMYSTGALEKGGVPRAAEVRDALRARSSGKDSEAGFATEAVGLLRQMGAGAAPVLAEFAKSHGNVKVREVAVRALGDLANRGDKALKARVGSVLAQLLQSDPPQPVLKQILFTLQAAPSDDAIPAIQDLLFPSDPKMALARDDVISCVETLAATTSPKALETLERLAREATDVTLRIDAVDRGLVARTRAGAQSVNVLNFLAGLVRDPKQPEELRLGVLSSLGAKGAANATPLLGELAADANLDAKFKTAASTARLALAARLVRGNGEVTAEVLAVVAIILAEEMTRPGADLAALLTTARTAVQVADRNKIKARGCRGLYASLLSKQPDAKPAEVRAAWKDAADKAAGDGLTPAQQVKALESYRTLLNATKPAKGAERAHMEETIRVNRVLLDIAKRKNDVPASYRYWLDALDAAIVKLRDRSTAEQIVLERPQGEITGDLATRWERLSKLLEALPKTG